MTEMCVSPDREPQPNSYRSTVTRLTAIVSIINLIKSVLFCKYRNEMIFILLYALHTVVCVCSERVIKAYKFQSVYSKASIKSENLVRNGSYSFKSFAITVYRCSVVSTQYYFKISDLLVPL